MKRLSRYLLTECSVTVSIALVVLTFLVLLPQIVKLMYLWVDSTLSIGILLHMTVLILPKFVVATLPMALLLGILLALGRLSQESEMVILRTSGVSLYQIARPIAILVLLATGFSLWLNWVAVPQSHQHFYQIKSAMLARSTLAIKSNTFQQILPGLTLYVREQQLPERILWGILIHDQRNADEPETVVARQGRLHHDSLGHLALYLEEGSRQRLLPGGGLRRLDFVTFDMDLGLDGNPADDPETRALATYSFSALYQAVDQGTPEHVRLARMEWHHRLAIPAATCILGLLAIPLGLQQGHRSGRGFGFVLAILVLMLHFTLITLGELLAHRHVLDPLPGYGAPNVLMVLLTLHVYRESARDRPVFLADRVQAAIQFLARVVSMRRVETPGVEA
ncbi:MAG: LptF/LptG family permease [Magnetococcales bacterium]|nr:LptF/LptG family permease [Magnetococcales bacterium]MBF0321973.1 LptF/LptG family permease [Magnetococcales bacterium]